MSSPPPFDDGPQKPHETREEWIQRLREARAAMGIQRKAPFKSAFPEQFDNEDVRAYRARQRNWHEYRDSEESVHAERIDPSSYGYDALYTERWMSGRAARHQANRNARAAALVARRVWDASNNRQASATPTYDEEDSGDELYDHEDLDRSQHINEYPSAAVQQQAQAIQAGQRGKRNAVKGKPGSSSTGTTPGPSSGPRSSPSEGASGRPGGLPRGSAGDRHSGRASARLNSNARSEDADDDEDDDGRDMSRKYGACASCKRRKKKCTLTNGFPCPECVARGEESQCVEATAYRRRRGVSTATRAANRPPPVSSSSPPRQLDLPIRRAPRSTRSDAQPPRLPTPNTGIDPDETQDEDEILDPSGNPVPERARMPEIMRQQRQATTNDPAHYANHPTSDRCQRCQDLNKSCCDLSVTGFPCRWCVHDNQICRDGSGRAVNRQSIHLRPEPVLPPVPQGASRHSAQARRAAYPASRRNNYPATRRQASNVKSKNNNNDNNGNKAKAKTTSSSPSSAAPVQRRGRRNTSTRNTNRNRSESPERDLIPCGNCKAAGEQCDFATPCRPCRLVKKEFTCSKDISYGEGAPQRNYYNGGDDNENDDADDDGNDDDDDLYNDDSTPADRKVAAIAAAIRNSRQTYNQEHAARFQNALGQASSMAGTSDQGASTLGDPMRHTQTYTSNPRVPPMPGSGDTYQQYFGMYPPNLGGQALVQTGPNRGFGGTFESLTMRTEQEIRNIRGLNVNPMLPDMRENREDRYEGMPEVDENEVDRSWPSSPAPFNILTTFGEPALSGPTQAASLLDSGPHLVDPSLRSFVVDPALTSPNSGQLTDQVIFNYHPLLSDSAPAPAPMILSNQRHFRHWEDDPSSTWIEKFHAENLCDEWANSFYRNLPQYQSYPQCKKPNAADCEVIAHGMDEYQTCRPCHGTQNLYFQERQAAILESTKGYVCHACAFKIRRGDLGHKDNCMCNGQMRKSWLCHLHREAGLTKIQAASLAAKEWVVRLNQGIEYCLGCFRNAPDPTSQTWGCYVCREWVFAGL